MTSTCISLATCICKRAEKAGFYVADCWPPVTGSFSKEERKDRYQVGKKFFAQCIASSLLLGCYRLVGGDQGPLVLADLCLFVFFSGLTFVSVNDSYKTLPGLGADPGPCLYIRECQTPPRRLSWWRGCICPKKQEMLAPETPVCVHCPRTCFLLSVDLAVSSRR